MKRLALLISLSLAIALSVHAQPGEKSPGAVIKNFYEWYMRAIDAGTDPFVKGRKTLLKYVTLRLVKQIERAEANGSDVDAFLFTQEFDATWGDKATVSYLRINGATGTAIVTFDATTNYPRVRVTLAKEAGVWKIDGVKSDPQK
jgi:Protein of unknown function (DUF3828)